MVCPRVCDQYDLIEPGKSTAESFEDEDEGDRCLNLRKDLVLG
ncbi:unnamed protein product [Rodentolepis nana]|uniref:Uncharacterized protein n=1 Tax=Rodentolepis nana TaxID=102285 RepID=A0A3P7SE64_RODNA|nr:unnamed protein product [Rodentolepis nana]